MATPLSISVPFPVFQDRDGQPLENGYIWLGVQNLNPQVNPVIAYFDEALTIVAPQPLRTLNGYISRAGTPAQVFIDGVNFSILVQDSKGSMVYNFPNGTGIDPNLNAADIVYDPAGVGAVATNVQAKLRQTVSIKDFGAIGDGVADDTAAIQAALTASKYVEVPSGMTCLISSTITIPSQTQLKFLGGDGNLVGAFPASYFIKKSTMTTVGISISQRGVVDGGGLLGQVGNTGDGVQLAGNAAVLRNFIVARAGRDGVRVGTDSVFANCNSTVIEYVKARENGRHGFYIHDGVSVGPADANAGILLKCTSIDNIGDGIHIGHAFWVSVINCLTEINDGWGLYLSGVDNASYPECRWTTVVGGDYNEGNITGQVYDGSYFATFLQPDGTSLPTTAITGLQGGGFRSAITASGISNLQGLNVQTNSAGAATKPLTVDAGASSSVTYPSRIRQETGGNNGDGVGLAFQIDPNTGTFINAAQVTAVQQAGGKFSLKFDVYQASAVYGAARFNADAVAFHPEQNDTWKLGLAGQRWSEVFAVNGAINTSDAREKQQVRDLSDTERAVAIRLKSLIRAFKWNNAVEKKGDKARIHIGVMAQEVKSAFEAEGLDAHKYGVLCYDKWDDEFEPEYEMKIVKDNGEEFKVPVATGKQKLVKSAGDAYGVRYDQLFSFIISAL